MRNEGPGISYVVVGTRDVSKYFGSLKQLVESNTVRSDTHILRLWQREIASGGGPNGNWSFQGTDFEIVDIAGSPTPMKAGNCICTVIEGTLSDSYYAKPLKAQIVDLSLRENHELRLMRIEDVYALPRFLWQMNAAGGWSAMRAPVREAEIATLKAEKKALGEELAKVKAELAAASKPGG